MTDNIAARAATEGELVKFESDHQWSQYGIAIQHPVTVFSARINQTFETLDGVYEFLYDGATGDLADVLAGMTVFIGSSAGAHDRGICRVRKLPTSDTLFINEVSDILFAEDDYVTVIDHMAIWPRDISEVGTTIMMDFDIEHGSYLNGGVIPRIGPMANVLILQSGTVSFTPVSPALSAAYDGATVDSWLWSAPGAASTADMDTETPVITYTAAGEYRIECAIVDSLGRTTTAYRRVFVNPTPIDFQLGTWSGDFDGGNWKFDVTCFDNVSLADVYDRAMVVLYARREYYGGAEGSIGRLAGYERVKCVGFIEGDSISYDSESGDVTFTVQGPGFWLDKIRAFPFELMDTAAAPANWKEIQEMTVDKALAHLLYWTSTAPVVMDCFFSGSTTRIKSLVQPSGSLLKQINAIGRDKIFAKTLINSYGQMFVIVDQQLLSSADRAAIPVVMDINSAHWLDGRSIERNTQSKTSMVELGAYQSYDGVSDVKVYSRAPGKIPKTYGDSANYEDYVVENQDECNRISGDLLAFENNQFEPFEIKLAHHNPLLDIAPLMYCTTTITAAENPRGVELVDVRIIPRKIEHTYSAADDTYLTSVVFEVETIGVPGVSFFPIDIGSGGGEEGGGGESTEWPIDETEYPVDGVEVVTPCASATANYFGLSWDIHELRGEDGTKLSAKCYFPCKIRADGGLYETFIALGGTWFGDAPTHYNVYGIKGGSRVITATVTGNKTGNRATFSPLSDTEVDGFEIALEAGIGSPLEYVVEEILTTGTVAATVDFNVDAYALTVGEYYAVNAWGGPWRKAPTWPDSYSILVANGANETGVPGIGLTGTSETTTDFFLNLGTLGIYASALSSFYGQIIFQASDPAWGVVVDDGSKADNTGSIGYTLRSVTANGRRILLGGATLNNVCKIE